ncbi:hypothetical protein BJ508DRAFT_412950 [Ascobolus immersus RN42]|uniref:SUI1 domain-containing protein n=1 Tax=Ascobolus immersus RN42 TaxID=1160509 RepID=A0A3N4IDP9_ASCIM|nr:hypothetical protein BJ508DRAFT_412950 [Ascobolus immersus RN42]
MFKKKPTVSTYAPIRSSDRRRKANEFIKDLNLSQPSSLSQAAAETPTSTDEAPNANAFANLILPDGSTSAKFTTYEGPNLTDVSGTLYSGSQPDGDQKASSKARHQRPLWVEIDRKSQKQYFPTVYTLWNTPEILPVVHTWGPVIKKIMTGADLMIPGLAGPPFPEKATKGSLVSIASADQPGVPLAVGYARVDIASLKNVVGEKGVAVEVAHWYGDEIWKLGGSLEPPESTQLFPDMEKMTAGVQGMSLSQEGETGETQADTTENSTAEVPDADRLAAHQLDTKEIDKAFKTAAIYGIYNARANNQISSIEFPLSSSTFMTSFVLPFLPPASQFDRNLPRHSHPSLQVKKTSWKGANKFLKALEKDGLLRIKTRGGGEVVILDIAWEDDRVREFQPYALPSKDKPSNHPTAPATGTTTAGSAPQLTTHTNDPVRILELLRASSRLFPIYDTIQADKMGYYTAGQVKSLFVQYLEKENLINQKNKRLVNINPIIANVLLDTSKREDAQILSTSSAKREDLTNRFVAAHNPYYAVMPRSLPPSEFNPKVHKPKSGKPPRITIQLETRTGKKVVTRVWGLEVFNVDPVALSEELSKVCASSSSTSPREGASQKDGNKLEVLVQGSQEQAVRGLLEKRGVEVQKVVEVVNKVGKKK